MTDEAVQLRNDSHRAPVWINSLGINALLLVVVTVFAAPFLWIATGAFSADELGAWPWPNGATFSNFSTLWDDYDLGISVRTSLIVSLLTMFLAPLLASLAGYVLSRRRSDGAANV